MRKSRRGWRQKIVNNWEISRTRYIYRRDTPTSKFHLRVPRYAGVVHVLSLSCRVKVSSPLAKAHPTCIHYGRYPWITNTVPSFDQLPFPVWKNFEFRIYPVHRFLTWPRPMWTKRYIMELGGRVRFYLVY